MSEATFRTHVFIRALLAAAVAAAVATMLGLAATWIALPSATELRASLRGQHYWPVVLDRHRQPLGPHPQGGYALDAETVPYNGTHTPADSLPTCATAFAKELEGYSPLGPKLMSLPKCLWEGRGCSTLDMQAARALYFATAREKDLMRRGNGLEGTLAQVHRKWLEMVMSMKMAWTLTEEERLDLFYNASSFVPQRRGIGYAAARLFGTTPNAMTCQQHLQALTLLPRPVRYRDADEFNRVYQRKLAHLLSEGLISKSNYTSWTPMPPLQWHSWSRSPDAASMDRAIEETRDILAGSGHRLSDGLRIVTSVDFRLQKRVAATLESEVDRWNGAIGTSLMMDGRGFYRAYVVSSHRQWGDLDFIGAPQQPGSRAKLPVFLLLVAYLLEQGYAPGDILEYPLPTIYQLEEAGRTREIGKRCAAHGETVSLRRALALSCNGSAYHAANEILSPTSTARFLSRLGIEVAPHEAIALGSWSLTEERVAALYTVLSGYRYVTPRIVERIYDRAGTLIYDAARDKGWQPIALAPEVAWMVRQVLRETVSEGTAKRVCAEFPGCDRLDLAVKTGSSAGRSRQYRGATGLTGRGLTVSVSLQADRPLPSAAHSAAPTLGRILGAAEPMMR